MKKMQFAFATGIALAAWGCCSSSFAQGSLTPPGAPGATMKTLDQMEPRTVITNLPYRIYFPGSYYLAGNLSTTESPAISVETSHVTMDLNGFRLQQVGLGTAIELSQYASNVVVQSGAITGYIGIMATNSAGLTVQDVSFSGCDYGIEAGDGLTVKNVKLIHHKGRTGIRGRNGCSVQDVRVQGGSTWGAIALGSGALVDRCVVQGLGVTYSASIVRAIQITDSGIVRNCTVSGCAVGTALFMGVSCAENSIIESCVVSSNSTSGVLQSVVAYKGSAVRECIVADNSGDGIYMFGQGVVSKNSCFGNGAGSSDGAGIRLHASYCRVEENLVAGNDRGIYAEYSGNVILRNMARGNTTNYVFASGNSYGTIQNITSSGGPVSGSSASSSLSTTDPWANFSY